jgi:hypothetical protein
VITAARLAGFFAAHAIWSVSDGATLIPILAYTTESGERHMERLVGELAAMVEAGRQRLDANPMDAVDAVLLYDGYLTIAGDKVDAILVEVLAYFAPGAKLTLGIPYTPLASGTFRVHKPKLLGWEHCDDFDQREALQNFFEGTAEHTQGSAVWTAALDESR